MNANFSVNIGKLKLKNPLMVASGTFGYAEEFKDFIDFKQLGAIVTKTITINPRKGNPAPRTCETPAGMLNSIGLENPGIAVFLKDKLPKLTRLGRPVIVSIAAKQDAQEFVTLAKKLDKIKEVAAIELNISCPNIRNRGLKTPNPCLISQDPAATYNLVKAVRASTKKVLITKLSPDVADIVKIALAAEGAGSDAVSLINTLSGMSIDIAKREPKIACVTGGLSGPAIRPVALRMVWQVYQKIKVPIIGMGGICDVESALEFFIAGATAIAVGTGNFIDPGVSAKIAQGIKKYLEKNKIKDINELTGSLTI